MAAGDFRSAGFAKPFLPTAFTMFSGAFSKNVWPPTSVGAI